MAWTAATAAPSGSFSPMRRATVAVAAMLSPSATLKISTMSDSVSPTAAMASAPSLRHPEGVHQPEGGLHGHLEDGGDGQQGDAAAEAAVVKSCSVPRRASRRTCHLPTGDSSNEVGI